jgi:hypothetical protein
MTLFSGDEYLECNREYKADLMSERIFYLSRNQYCDMTLESWNSGARIDVHY